jgi:hypothetical protein
MGAFDSAPIMKVENEQVARQRRLRCLTKFNAHYVVLRHG